MRIVSLEQKLLKGGIFFEKASPKDLSVPIHGKISGKEHTVTFSEVKGHVYGTVIFEETEALRIGDILHFCDEVTDVMGTP